MSLEIPRQSIDQIRQAETEAQFRIIDTIDAHMLNQIAEDGRTGREHLDEMYGDKWRLKEIPADKRTESEQELYLIGQRPSWLEIEE